MSRDLCQSEADYDESPKRDDENSGQGFNFEKSEKRLDEHVDLRSAHGRASRKNLRALMSSI
jgi:hypothetical protein